MWAFDERIVDDLALPGAFVPAVNDGLVAVPGFDDGKEAGLASLADGDVAGAALGPGSGVAFADFGALPGTGFVEF